MTEVFISGMTLIEIVISIIAITLVLMVVSSIIIYSIYNGVSPMPTSRKVTRALLEIAVSYRVSGTVFELGSGWGNLALLLARTLPACQVIGYENSPVPYLFSRVIAMIFPAQNLHLIRNNFFRTSLSGADLVVSYLHPDAMKELKVKFEHDLKEGSLVISNTFAVPGWEPIQIRDISDLYHTRIYVYRVGISEDIR
jgi:hypothetical protein